MHTIISFKKQRRYRGETKSRCNSCKHWLHRNCFRFDHAGFVALSDKERLTCYTCSKKHKSLHVFKDIDAFDLNDEKCMKSIIAYSIAKGTTNFKLSLTRSKNRIPKYEDLNKIKEIYIMSVFAGFVYGKKFEVDHCIPLNGDYVSGLHSIYNLQILDKVMNRAKTNMHIEVIFDKAEIDEWFTAPIEKRLKYGILHPSMIAEELTKITKIKREVFKHDQTYYTDKPHKRKSKNKRNHRKY